MFCDEMLDSPDNNLVFTCNQRENLVLHQESSKALIHALLLDYRTDTSIFMDSHFVLEILHVSYSNIRHLHNAASWFCPGFSGSSGNLQKWPSSQHGSVRDLFFLFFSVGY